MTDEPHRDPQTTNRWTKEGATEGEDPREIDEEQLSPEYVRRLQEHRQVTHAEQETDGAMGTSSTTYDPTERD
ncbi:hypothetical protein [Thermasporomyces composti]|uniref:DUF3072 family protein n=1 Tax=Thermasporomyces composti TaxID=696763 RepID=A0A3D9VIG6_THECX|nr:hypothetical protein [Thermasporomyces composti]REF37101.1 hypothetical protein DFJ64_2537 [Thermasporomyces composti]